MTTPDQMPDFPVLEISAFLDFSTVTLVGARVHFLEEGEELYVLGLSSVVVPKTSAPLVVPKATIEVIAQAGAYAVAKTPAKETLVPTGTAALMRQLVDGLETQFKSQPLTKDESQFLGNPARSRISVGDTVVRKADFIRFVEWKAS